MRILTYGIMTLVILAISSPMLALAETENEEDKMTQKTSTSENENEGNEMGANSVNSDLILYVTIASIGAVVSYSAWKIYKIRRKTTSKNMV